MFGTKPTSGLRSGDSTKMKIKNGYNQVEKKFFIQITDRANSESLRIYMEPESFKNFAYHMIKTCQFSS